MKLLMQKDFPIEHAVLPIAGFTKDAIVKERCPHVRPPAMLMLAVEDMLMLDPVTAKWLQPLPLALMMVVD